jgi:hypothetical protein
MLDTSKNLATRIWDLRIRLDEIRGQEAVVEFIRRMCTSAINGCNDLKRTWKEQKQRNFFPDEHCAPPFSAAVVTCRAVRWFNGWETKRQVAIFLTINEINGFEEK